MSGEERRGKIIQALKKTVTKQFLPRHWQKRI